QSAGAAALAYANYCIVSGFSVNGIYNVSGSINSITNCTIYNCGIGINNASGATIAGAINYNIFHTCTTGIFSVGASSLINYNVYYNNTNLNLITT
ncbi:MAG: hypothetical protein V4490_02440, partial [Pseudomonadota bacterium]